jgi:adenosine deaminase
MRYGRRLPGYQTELRIANRQRITLSSRLIYDEVSDLKIVTRGNKMYSVRALPLVKLRRVLVLLFVFSALAFAQSKAARSAATNATAEQRTSRAFDAARANPLELRAFLVTMPKGADLHNHLYGAIYAETWIRDGAQDRLCVNLAKLSFFKSQAMTDSTPPQPVCGEGNVPAGQALKDQHLYDALIDSFSMRGFVPTPGTSGHDHFFDTFARFGGNLNESGHLGEWLDELATRAASQNEQYLELLHTPDFRHAAALAKELGWPSSASTPEDFSKLRDELFAHGLRDEVATASTAIDQAEKLRNQRERCGQQGQAPACKVQIRFLYQILRGFPKEQVFAQTLLAFETASADQRFVGINLVMPEDGYLSTSDYALQMRMVGYFHGLYPKVHISLHAGEIAPGLVTYEGLCCHVRLAVEDGHAERIGHGVDVMYENRPYDLLKEMAAQHVLVEINLTSNDVILGVSGKSHPFPIYRKFGVPVALSTDDEGVSRIDLTHEYVRAAETYALSYADLKQMVRASLEHSFLPGASLWNSRDVFTKVASACTQEKLGDERPSSACANFLKSSEKAQQQWELERRFAAFQSTF